VIPPARITTRSATFQQWQALLTNRSKRHRAREFVVQGVRPITLALENRWPLHLIIHDLERPLSSWARNVVERADAPVVAMASDLIRELGGKDDQTPELVAIAGIPADDLNRIPAGPSFLGTVFDRPIGPGNIGTLIRSVDAFGGSGVIVTGHAADPYDPKSVRASTGSLFSVPVVRVPSHREVLRWVDVMRQSGTPIAVIGTDETGEIDLHDCDLTRPTLILIGNETAGLSASWRESCDRLVRIPITGTASSLNAANAAAIVLYETSRQRSRMSDGSLSRR
jgi:TrmH family RNA methyltransferase